MTAPGADRKKIRYRRRKLLPDWGLALRNLASRKLRSLLTMLGMIFGVGAVVSMLSIGAGAQQQVLAFIEQLGVRNLIVEAKDINDQDELVKLRKTSPGLSFKDLRVIRANIAAVSGSTPRKIITPNNLFPKSKLDMPNVYGVESQFRDIAGLRIVAGRFFTMDENEQRRPVCVLGEGAKDNLFPQREAVGESIKIQDQWFRIIGVLGSRLVSQGDLSGVKTQDLNNLIYMPINTMIYRLEGNRSYLKDEIDGIYLQLHKDADVPVTANMLRGILNTSHRNAADFSLIVPAELLAEKKRAQRIFEMVMVAIASISLLVGGIGIMNIMLASILERTHEIGVRRAVGGRKRDVLHQFLVEAILISFVGGLLGIACGFGLSRLVAVMAGWSTIITVNSILLAFIVSVSVGLIFGIYPAAKAARLDPVEALRHEG
jgi:putative ABC transport system permease protein